MTVIQYGSSVSTGNAKTRRHERRRKLAIERDAISNIIDSVFGCTAPDASQEQPKRMSKVDRAIATATTLAMFGKEMNSGASCLPEVALYAAGHRKSKAVTAR